MIKTAQQYLEETPISPAILELQEDWHKKDRPINHPFVHALMEDYADIKYADLIKNYKDRYVDESEN